MFVIIPDEMCIEKASSILGYFCIVGVPRPPNNKKITGNPKSGFVSRAAPPPKTTNTKVNSDKFSGII